MKIILFILTINIMAFEYKPNTQTTVPYELESLILSIDWKNINQKQADSFKKNFGRVDFLINLVNPINFQFITKTFIYKYLLTERPNESLPNTFFKTISLQKIEDNLTKSNLNPFANWVLVALRQDLISNLNDPDYSNFVKYKSGSLKASRAINKLSKKFNILIPWYLFFQNRSSDQVNFHFQSVMNNLLEKLVQNLIIYQETISLSKISFPELHKLRHFNIYKDKTETEVFNPLDDIDKITLKNKKAGLPLPNDSDWIPKSSDIAKQRSPIKIKKIKDYKAPEELPEPVNDWILDY